MKRFLRLESRDAILVMAMAMFMVQLDATVLIVALPSIAADFGVPTLSLSLSITIYLTMLVAMLPLSRWAADRFGARRVFSWAILGFAVASGLCALCQSFWPFIAARALQGAAAALVAPVGRLILLKQTPKAELVDALSITAMPMLVAPTLGPSIGGFIVDYGRWEYIFVLNLPIAALLIWVTQRRLAPIAPERGHRLDWLGALLMAGALVSGLTGLDRLTGTSGHALAWILVAAGAVLGWATVRHLRRHPHPILSLEPLRDKLFATTVIGAGAISRVPARAVMFVVPLMLQIGLGMSPFVAGLMLIALSGGDLVTKPLVGVSFERFGFARTIRWASIAGLVGAAALALMVPGGWAIPLILTALLVSGVSRSLVFTGMVSQGFMALREPHVSSGNVVSSISQQLINALTVLGAAMLLATLASFDGRTEPVMGDFRIALWVIVAIGALATFRLEAFMPARLGTGHADD